MLVPRRLFPRPCSVKGFLPSAPASKGEASFAWEGRSEPPHSTAEAAN